MHEISSGHSPNSRIGPRVLLIPELRPKPPKQRLLRPPANSALACTSTVRLPWCPSPSAAGARAITRDGFAFAHPVSSDHSNRGPRLSLARTLACQAPRCQMDSSSSEAYTLAAEALTTASRALSAIKSITHRLEISRPEGFGVVGANLASSSQQVQNPATLNTRLSQAS